MLSMNTTTAFRTDEELVSTQLSQAESSSGSNDLFLQSFIPNFFFKHSKNLERVIEKIKIQSSILGLNNDLKLWPHPDDSRC